MGDDLPSLLADFELSQGHFSDKGGTALVKVVLQKGDGGLLDVDFEVPSESAILPLIEALNKALGR